MRDYWRQQGTSIAELAYRLTGSSDLYEATGRRPVGQRQLRHRPRRLHPRRPGQLQQQAQRGQREGNQDGFDDNRSWNCGVEGPTDDPEVIVDLRRRQVRNFLTTLALSLGVPCCSAATNSGVPSAATTTPTARTTRSPGTTGTNVDSDMLAWARAVLNLRRDHPLFRRRRFLQGRPLRQARGDPATVDIGWFRPDGRRMTDADWGVGYAKSLGILLNGAVPTGPDRHGRQVQDASFYLALNAWEQPLGFRLPAKQWGGPWQVVLDTSNDRPLYKTEIVEPREHDRPHGPPFRRAAAVLRRGRPPALRAPYRGRPGRYGTGRLEPALRARLSQKGDRRAR